MAFQDFDEYYDDHLALPFRGVTYRVPPPSGKAGVAMQRMFGMAVAVKAGVDVTGDDLKSIELDDAQEKDLYQTALGPVYDEMVANDVPPEIIAHAGQTAYMWTAAGREVAEGVWNNFPGKAPAPAPRPQPQDRKPRQTRQPKPKS